MFVGLTLCQEKEEEEEEEEGICSKANMLQASH
jgi:hypothetical protein